MWVFNLDYLYFWCWLIVANRCAKGCTVYTTTLRFSKILLCLWQAHIVRRALNVRFRRAIGSEEPITREYYLVCLQIFCHILQSNAIRRHIGRRQFRAWSWLSADPIWLMCYRNLPASVRLMGHSSYWPLRQWTYLLFYRCYYGVCNMSKLLLAFSFSLAYM